MLHFLKKVQGKILPCPIKGKEAIAHVCSRAREAVFPSAVVSALLVGTSVVPFASSGSSSIPSIGITEAMLQPVVDGVIANLNVIVPIGIGIFVVILGVKLVPRLLGYFLRI